MTSKIKIWMTSARTPFLIASAIPILFAGALSSSRIQNFDWAVFWAAFFGMVLVHAAANMTNEYYDFLNKTDIVNKNRTLFSGGTGLLVNGTLSLKSVKLGFWILYFIAFLLGAFVFLRVGQIRWLFLSIVTAGFLLTYFYSCPPINFAHRGLGELVVGICFGPLPMMGTYILLTGRVELLPILASIPIMMLIIAVLYINQFPDTDADIFAQKRNLVVRLGVEKARYGYYVIMGITYVSIILLAVFRYLPIYSLAALMTLPIAFKSSRILHANFNNPKAVFPAMGMTILNHHITGLILTGSLLVEKFTK